MTALLLVGLLATALSAPAAAEVETRRAYFHGSTDDDPDHWVNFDADDPSADMDLYEDDYIAAPATGMVWFASFDFDPNFDRTVELAPDATIDGTLVFCSEVFLTFHGVVQFGVGHIVGEDEVSLTTGPVTGCGEFSFSIAPDNTTIPADKRVWFNIDPETASVSGLLLMTLSQHETPSYFDLSFVVPDEVSPQEGQGTGQAAPTNTSGSGSPGAGQGSAGPGSNSSTSGSGGSAAGGGSAPATPGFEAAVAVVAAGLWALVRRRRDRG